jgi:hypothetical protein
MCAVPWARIWQVVTSYMSVVPGYVGSFGYDHAPRCCKGRRQVVAAMSIRYGSFAVVSITPTFGNGVGVLKDVMGLDVLWCRTFSLVSWALALSANHVSCVTLACMNRPLGYSLYAYAPTNLSFNRYSLSWDWLECVSHYPHYRLS